MAVINLTKENFENEAVRSEIPVLIDFWAPWCAPCRALGPTIEELGNECSDYKICKVNVDEQPELAARFMVRSIPNIVIMSGGSVVQSVVGGRSKETLLELLSEAK
ncbi:MAG: thioredoxin [Firmicutes bacterium]|nr:thioredoxin [Bacillota bacterium]